MSAYDEREKRTRDFQNDRFGMFIHWGLYAIPARGEWVRSVERISNEDYQKYFHEFNPVRYDPRQWARLAKEAGMRYAVMTTKHHDGFCLFDSKHTDYKATNTKAGRDLIREYADAFRAEGLKVGFYYSLLDWHHPDYPHFGDANHPMRDNEAFKGKEGNFANYVEYLHNQVDELIHNYGKIDIMWFDFSYGEMSGEKWEATRLVNRIRSVWPEIIIDNRLGGDPKDAEPAVYAGDFASPEQYLPAEGVKDALGRDMPWEACMTLNNNWGYASGDGNWKTSRNVVRMIVENVSKGGNTLLNVGPNAKGEIPKESAAILKEVGEWMRENGDSVYGCEKSFMPRPEWGRYTQNGKLLYAHVFDRGLGSIRFDGLRDKIRKARLLADGSELKLQAPWNAWDFPNDAFVEFVKGDLPDETDTVIELELV